jgi:hypothetical protein
MLHVSVLKDHHHKSLEQRINYLIRIPTRFIIIIKQMFFPKLFHILVEDGAYPKALDRYSVSQIYNFIIVSCSKLRNVY